MIELAISYPRSPELFSRLIARKMRQKHGLARAGSHVLLIYKGYVWHCVEGGPCLVPLEEFLKEYELLEREIIPSTKDAPELEAFLRGSLRGRYSWAQALAIKIPFLQRFKYFQNGSAESICSEWVATILYYIGIEAEEFIKADFLDPYEVLFYARRELASRRR